MRWILIVHNVIAGLVKYPTQFEFNSVKIIIFKNIFHVLSYVKMVELAFSNSLIKQWNTLSQYVLAKSNWAYCIEWIYANQSENRWIEMKRLDSSCGSFAETHPQSLLFYWLASIKFKFKQDKMRKQCLSENSVQQFRMLKKNWLYKLLKKKSTISWKECWLKTDSKKFKRDSIARVHFFPSHL